MNMAHLLANPHINIQKNLCIEPSNGNTHLKQGRTNYLMDYGESWRNIAGQSGKRISEMPWQMMKARGIFVVHSSSSSSTSSAEEVGLVGNRKCGEPEPAEGQFDRYLVNEYGWKVRRLVENTDEMKKVAQVQAEAFHVPVSLFNDLFFDFFQVNFSPFPLFYHILFLFIS